MDDIQEEPNDGELFNRNLDESPPADMQIDEDPPKLYTIYLCFSRYVATTKSKQ